MDLDTIISKHIPEIFWETLTLKIKKKYPNKKIYQIGETFGIRELIGRYISSGKSMVNLILIYILT